MPTLSDYCGRTAAAAALSEVDGSPLAVSVVVAQTQSDRYCQICLSPETSRFCSDAGPNSFGRGAGHAAAEPAVRPEPARSHHVCGGRGRAARNLRAGGVGAGAASSVGGSDADVAERVSRCQRCKRIRIALLVRHGGARGAFQRQDLEAAEAGFAAPTDEVGGGVVEGVAELDQHVQRHQQARHILPPRVVY